MLLSWMNLLAVDVALVEASLVQSVYHCLRYHVKVCAVIGRRQPWCRSPAPVLKSAPGGASAPRSR